MKSTRKNKIKAQPIDLLDDNTFNPKETKFRVTMFIDLDVLEVVRKKAKMKRLPYQTYINLFLRETHLEKKIDNVTDIKKRLERIEKELKLA